MRVYKTIQQFVKMLSDIPDVPSYVAGKVLGVNGDGNLEWRDAVVQEINYPQVATYADLPAAEEHAWEVYIVRQSTGILFINRKAAGFYQSDSTAWNYLDNGQSVDLTSDQTIDGTKTFLDSPAVPDGIQAGHAVNKGQLDAHVNRTDNPHNVTANQIGAETPVGAQEKADLAQYNAIAAAAIDATNKVSAHSAATIAHTWNQIENKPTTVSGYGIIDAYTKTEIDGIILAYTVINGLTFSDTIPDTDIIDGGGF